MEKIYKKNKNGDFEEVGYINLDLENFSDVTDYFKEDGIWLVKRAKGSKSSISMLHRISEIPKPNLKIHSILQNYEEKLVTYLANLKEIDTDEYKEAKSIEGGYLSGPLEIYNWSLHSLSLMILREFAKWTQEDLENDKI